MMDKEKYKKLISGIIPKEDRLKNGIIAFLIGGLVGFLSELMFYILVNNYNISENFASSLMIVSWIFLASLLTALGVFDDVVSFAKAGLIVPITGFAHAMTSSIIEYRREGFITGMGTNAFKLTGSVILYGVVAAAFFGTIRYLFFGG